MRPVDHLPKPASWQSTVKDAHALGICAKCGRKATPFFHQTDMDEYLLSGMCKTCQVEFFDDHPRSAWDPDYEPSKESA